uniref:Translation-associated GTPase n=1 Tax=uncultured marine thaumarchaeote KM3_12_C10 TaxID=1455998 RepID=A0A075G913_9ARCH|nr:translation-associated GTPase [uncultured marine thaumarchaeote KM3_12_C10]
MQIGLLGKANVGKSTFFSAATETVVPSGNFPFTTIEPNVGVCHLKINCECKNLGKRCGNDLCHDGTRFIPVKLIDVAGLVPGAHEGKGLGNQFLTDAMKADALIHVVDISGSTDIQGQPVNLGTHDPLEDIKFVEEEFDLWFKDLLDREWPKLVKEIEQKRAKISEGITRRFTGLGILESQVDDVLNSMSLKAKKPQEWSKDDMMIFLKSLRKKAKPLIIAANKADLCDNLDILKKISETFTVICSSAETELLLKKATKAKLIDYIPGDENFQGKDDVKLSDQQNNALHLAKNVLTKIQTTGVQTILNSIIFDVLDMIVVYPVEDETKLTNKEGQVLPDARLLKNGSTSKDLAFTIHQDIGKGFLHAVDAKSKQRIGADHQLKNGDIVKIVSTLSRG